MHKTCFVIVGPTASGKTSLAIEVANYFNTSIISADSRQCFKELNIGVAKPSDQQLEQVKHYFINSHSIFETVNAALFEQFSLECISNIFSEKNFAVVTGGTGLYLKAFEEGLDDMPPGDQTVRQALIAEYEKNGIDWLREKVREEDPDFFNSGEIQNPQRMIRALEVKQISGQTINSFKKNQKKIRPFQIIKIGLTLPREILYENINTRVDQMFNRGLEEEALQLYPLRSLNALQTVGYTELFEHFDGQYSIDEASDKIKQNTRHYAKRQITWFGKDDRTQWFHPDETRAIIEFASITSKN